MGAGDGMKVTPLLMKGDLVVATLEGRKTETRRLKNLEYFNEDPDLWSLATPEQWAQKLAANGCYGRSITEEEVEAKADKLRKSGAAFFRDNESGRMVSIPCPYGAAGDLIWIKETHAFSRLYDPCAPRGVPVGSDVYYKASMSEQEFYSLHAATRVSIHMMRWASRLTLEIISVSVERLQDITDEGANAEGCRTPATAARSNLRNIWQSINGDGSWDVNPYVWVIKYRAIKENVDRVIEQRESA